MQATNNAATPRMEELDGVRGFAAIAVVYAHLFLMWMPAPNSAAFWLRTASGMAWTGVILFFALSGFLIGGNLLRNAHAKNYFHVFYLRRALRIFPLYYLLLAVVFLLRFTSFSSAAAFQSEEIPFWNYPFLIQNFPMALTGNWGVAVLGVTWSVALEEQFYLFVPLLVRYVAPRWLPLLILLMIASGPLFRWLVPMAHAPFILPGSMESLFGGVLLAWLHREHPAYFRSARWQLTVLGVLAASGAGMFLLAAKRDFDPFAGTVMTLFWTSFLWLVLARMATPWTAFFRWGWLREIGRISYGIYLFHFLIYIVTLLVMTGGGPVHSLGRTGLWIAVASAILTFVFASASFHFFENRLIKIGHRLSYRH